MVSRKDLLGAQGRILMFGFPEGGLRCFSVQIVMKC